MGTNPRIVWEGPQLVNSSLALVNRSISLELIKRADFHMTLLPSQRDTVSPEWSMGHELPDYYGSLRNVLEADVHIRQQWPPSFRPSLAKKYVMFQPWEYGTIPRDWVDPIDQLVDEVWVNSEYTKNGYVQSGIKAEKVFVFPLGIDLMTFNPQGHIYKLSTEKTFKFLFVGGTIYRKGIDKLLEAYTSTFTRSDDVTLVIKDFGKDSYYKGQTYHEWIQQLAVSAEAPEIIYLDDEMTPSEIASLYRSCQCLVHPYRGEGFGLPILEAMGCGLAPIIPDKGPAVEFTTDDTSFRVQSSIQVAELPNLETVLPAELVDVDVTGLGRVMKGAYTDQNKVREVGLRASQHVASRYSWAQIAGIVSTRLKYLATSDSLPLPGDVLNRNQFEYTVKHLEAAFKPQQVDKELFYRNIVKSFNKGDTVIDLYTGDSLWTSILTRAEVSRIEIPVTNMISNRNADFLPNIEQYTGCSPIDGASAINLLEYLDPHTMIRLLNTIVNQMSHCGRLVIITLNNQHPAASNILAWHDVRGYSSEFLQTCLLQLGFRSLVHGKSPGEVNHVIYASLLADDNPFL